MLLDDDDWWTGLDSYEWSRAQVLLARPDDRRIRLLAKLLGRSIEKPAPAGCEHLGPCRIWQGANSGKGRGGFYSRVCIEGATMAAHIAMWVILHGPIPPKKQLDHLCNRRGCIEDRHLELVTHKENQRRRDARAHTR